MRWKYGRVFLKISTETTLYGTMRRRKFWCKPFPLNVLVVNASVYLSSLVKPSSLTVCQEVLFKRALRWRLSSVFEHICESNGAWRSSCHQREAVISQAFNAWPALPQSYPSWQAHRKHRLTIGAQENTPTRGSCGGSCSSGRMCWRHLEDSTVSFKCLKGIK